MTYRYLCRDWDHPEWEADYMAFTHLPKVRYTASYGFEWLVRRGKSKLLLDERALALVGRCLGFGEIIHLPHGLKATPAPVKELGA